MYLQDRERKLNTETNEQYVSRMISYKDIYDYTWDQITDICNYETGWSKSETFYRRHFMNRSSNKHAPINQAQITLTPMVEQTEADDCDELTELRNERFRLTQERNEINRGVRRICREDTIKIIAAEIAENFNTRKPLLSTREHPIRTTKKVAIAPICDWHYGIEISNAFNQYNPDICRERVSSLLAQTIDICEKNDIHEIHVVNLGDMIAGRIHSQIRLQSQCDVIDQITNVSEIIAEYLSELSTEFKVHYYDCLDNHGRVEPNKSEAMDMESFSRITVWFLRTRLAANKNIIIHDNEFGRDIISFSALNFSIAGVHGDKDSPNKVVDNLTRYTERHYDLILAAHLHHFGANESGNTQVLLSGSLMGTDDYAQRLRLKSPASQNLIIATEDNVLYSIHKLILK